MAKTKSHGTTVTVGGASIGGLTDISISGADVPAIDITTHDSTAKEFVSGLIDWGTLELTGKFDAANSGQDALRAGLGASAAFVVTLPNAATISFIALIGGVSEDIPLEDAVGFSVSCKITGAKTYSA